jgi:hypothetical protein
MPSLSPATWSKPSTPRDLAAEAFWSESHWLNRAYRRANPGKAFGPSHLRAFVESNRTTLYFLDQPEAA